MARTNFRVLIPTKISDQLDLAKRIYDKHTELGDNSPLKMLETNTWEENGPKIAECRALHDEAEALARRAEELYRKRDAMREGIMNSVKGSRDILTGVYRKSPKSLGDFGFTVDDTR